MMYQPGDIVRATITSNSTYLITKEASGFVGIVIHCYESETRRDSKELTGPVTRIEVIPLYGVTSSVFSYYKLLQHRKQQDTPVYPQVESFFQRLYSNGRIHLDHFPFIKEHRFYDVDAAHFEKIQDTSYTAFKAYMQREVQTLHIYERKIDPDVAKRTTELVNQFFADTKHLGLSAFSATNKPNLSL